MFDFKTSSEAPKPQIYTDLLDAIKAVTHGESDSIANMANVAALLWQFLPDLNWAGFYRMVDGELVLGPFAGKPACIRIALDKGVCGAAARTGEAQLVDDVHAFPGHIACDGDTQSELVVPVIQNGSVTHVIDLDSPSKARFDKDDLHGIAAIASYLADYI